ncbi:caspase domain-containing protein [Salix suchowensis]|nr:caspase domain-containing protein [Salix suchowensis]
MPSSRLFALIVGIDAYKSGSIWNLESCAQDAKKVQAWLTHDLCVPKDQICMLLDHKATKAAIEDRFMSTSVIPAPKNWFEGESRASLTDTVEALLTELCKAKGDNVTLILDCCFSPRQTKELLRERRSLRWTPSPKSDPSDLLSGLWGGAPAQKPARNNGFYRVDAPTHVLIAACRPGEGAAEGKEGGRLTAALLEASATLQLHNLTYKQLVNRLAAMMSAARSPCALGDTKNGCCLTVFRLCQTHASSCWARRRETTQSRGNSAHIEHHDDLMSLCRRVVRIDDTMGALSLLDKAARFHLHLHRRNPESPLHNLVQMELYKLDPISWRKTGTNLLKDGQAKIDYEKDALYSVVMHNNSQVDLWPSLVYMDPNCYGITMLYHPMRKPKLLHYRSLADWKLGLAALLRGPVLRTKARETT